MRVSRRFLIKTGVLAAWTVVIGIYSIQFCYDYEEQDLAFDFFRTPFLPFTLLHAAHLAFCFFQIFAVQPDTVPITSEWRPTAEQLDAGERPRVFVKRVIPADAISPNDNSPFALERYRYCQVCAVFKPDRAHHCSSCDRCVLNMDHHCYILANCVGHSNRKIYLHLLASAFAFIGGRIVIMIDRIILISKLLRNISRNKMVDPPSRCSLRVVFVFFTILTVLSLPICGYLAYLFCYSIKLILRNETMLEAQLPEENAKEYNRVVWDIGILSNLRSALGRHFLFWFVPLPLFLVDGTHFEPNYERSELDASAYEAEYFADDASRIEIREVLLRA